MVRKLMLAIAAVAFVATPSFAAVQNVKVSGKIDSSYVYRDRFDLDGRNGAGANEYDQKFFLTQTYLRVDADLSDNVQTVIQLINERAWDQPSSSDQNTDIELNLAYVRLKEMLYSPLTVEIGRMQLNYGNGFIIGNGTNNSTYSNNNLAGAAADLANNTAFDTIRTILDYKPLTIDVFASKVNANNVAGGSGLRDDDVDLYGINANYQLGDDMNTVVEAYFFTKYDRSVESAAGAKADKIYTPGLRASTNPISGLNVQGEVAWQKGNKVLAAGYNQPRDAFALQGIASYQIQAESVAQWKPVVSSAYTFVSGDSNPADVYTHVNGSNSHPASKNVWTAWDPMFEGQSGGKIYNSLFNLTNDHIVELAAAVNPLEDVTAKLTWTGLWLDKHLAGAANGGETTGLETISSFPILPDGTANSSRMTSNLELGQEIDADLTYAYTEDVSIGLSLGWFFPGNAFDSLNNENAKQAIAHVGVSF